MMHRYLLSWGGMERGLDDMGMGGGDACITRRHLWSFCSGGKRDGLSAE